MFFRAVTTPLMTLVPNFNKWCAVSSFLFKNIGFCIFTPKTLLVKENYFLTLRNFTYLKDTSFGKKSYNFEHGLQTKNEFEKWPLITFFQCTRVWLHVFESRDESKTTWIKMGNKRRTDDLAHSLLSPPESLENRH